MRFMPTLLALANLHYAVFAVPLEEQNIPVLIEGREANLTVAKRQDGGVSSAPYGPSVVYIWRRKEREP